MAYSSINSNEEKDKLIRTLKAKVDSMIGLEKAILEKTVFMTPFTDDKLLRSIHQFSTLRQEHTIEQLTEIQKSLEEIITKI